MYLRPESLKIIAGLRSSTIVQASLKYIKAYILSNKAFQFIFYFCGCLHLLYLSGQSKTIKVGIVNRDLLENPIQ